MRSCRSSRLGRQLRFSARRLLRQQPQLFCCSFALTHAAGAAAAMRALFLTTCRVAAALIQLCDGRRRERMLEEKTQHFPCGIGSSRISIGARGAASRPCVSGTVHIPMLQHCAPVRVAMNCAGIGMAPRYLPAVHLLLCPPRSHRLENLVAVVWMHRSVAIAVKNNGRDRWFVT